MGLYLSVYLSVRLSVCPPLCLRCLLASSLPRARVCARPPEATRPNTHPPTFGAMLGG